MAVEIASTVTRGITVFGEMLAEHRLWLNDDAVLAAVEEHVLVLDCHVVRVRKNDERIVS